MSTYRDIKEILKDVSGLFKKGMTIEEREKVAELREACLTLLEEKIQLKEKNKNLEEALSIKETLKYKPPFYYSEKDSEPCCSRCWEKDRRIIHVGPEEKGDRAFCRICPECKSEFKTRDYESVIAAVSVRQRERSLY